mgnify:CR=1 FL=1
MYHQGNMLLMVACRREKNSVIAIKENCFAFSSGHILSLSNIALWELETLILQLI